MSTYRSSNSPSATQAKSFGSRRIDGSTMSSSTIFGIFPDLKPKMHSTSFHKELQASLRNLSTHNILFRQVSASSQDLTCVQGTTRVRRFANQVVSDASNARIPPMKSTQTKLSAYGNPDSGKSASDAHTASAFKMVVIRSCFNVRKLGKFGLKFRNARLM